MKRHHRELSKGEVLESIKKRSVLDEIDVFVLGLDAPLEREIMRYIWSCQNVVNFQMLVLHFVEKQGVCTKSMLERRLESLVKFDFIKRSDYRGTIFYEIKKEDKKKEEQKI